VSPSTTLAPDQRQRLLDAVKAGTPRDAAARYAGLAPAELEVLLARTPALEAEVLAAEASLEVATAAGMATAAKRGDWRAGDALIKRRGISAPVPRCGALTRADKACAQPRGHRTDHPGFGNCWLHGGRSPNGKKHAERQAAQAAVARLGIPTGNSDPFALLAKAVSHADGHLEAASAVVQEAAELIEGQRSVLALEAAIEVYEQAIRTAFRTAKAAVDADVADRLAALDERAASLLMRFVTELLERFVPTKRKGEGQAWAAARLAELAAEYERPGALH
jgi:hypothetical protein